MSIHFEIVDTEQWPAIRHKIMEERERRVDGLLHVTPEGLRGEQQYIAALDWVLLQAVKVNQEDPEPIYND